MRFQKRVLGRRSGAHGIVPIVNHALVEVLVDVATEVMRLDLSPHIIGVEVEPVEYMLIALMGLGFARGPRPLRASCSLQILRHQDGFRLLRQPHISHGA